MFHNIILYDWATFFKEVAGKIVATDDLPEREGLLRQKAIACFPADTPICLVLK